jgi:hypothetical protein
MLGVLEGLARSLGYHVVEGIFSGTAEVSVLMDGPRAWADVNAARAEVSEAIGWWPKAQ